MYDDKRFLTAKEILDKDFKIDARGYRPQEVDKFLDAIIRDYEEFFKIIREIESDKKELIEDNLKLKQEIRNLRTKLDIVNQNTNREVNNSDLLRRLSNLENIIYGDNK